MGLLDSLLYDSGTYGDQTGGLLSRLQPLLGQLQPSAGFPQQNAGPNFSDRFAALPNADAPAMASPMNVGGYQMPRLGSEAQYAAIPQNAQPAQGQMQAPQQMPPQQQTMPTFLGGQQGGGSGFGDRLMAGVQNFANAGGPLQALAGGISGLATGSRTDPAGMQQQNLAAQYQSLRQSLIENGETPQAANSKAMLAVMNPEVAKTVIPELFTNKQKYQVISEDPLEGKKYGFVNERDQTVNDRPINSAQPATGGGSLASIQAAQNAGIKGDALYEHLPASMRNTVKAMIEGRQPLPSTTAMRSPATLAMIDAAHAIDPTFDATVWKARNEAGPDWSKGKSSEMVRAANQTLGHVGTLMDSMDALKNTTFPAANWVGNNVREQLGSGEQGTFRTNAHAVAEEMSKVFKGANLSDAEIRHWEQNLTENMSPTQQRAQIAILSKLLHGSLDALEKKRADALGPAAAAKAPPIIGEEGKQVLERIDKWTKGNAEPSKAGGVDKAAIEAEMRKRGLLK